MEHNKYKELKDKLNIVSEKLDSQHRIINGTMLVFQDADVQMQTIKDFLIERGVMTEAEYNERVDIRRGLRIMGPEDKIKNGDIAWVSYIAKIDGEIIASDDLPVRVGSGAINFEHDLLGKSVGEVVDVSHTVTEEGPINGKSVNFIITINKAKTKIVNEEEIVNEPSNVTPIGGSGEPAGATASDGADAQSGGPTDQEQHPSQDPVVLAGGPSDAGQESHGGDAPSPN